MRYKWFSWENSHIISNFKNPTVDSNIFALNYLSIEFPLLIPHLHILNKDIITTCRAEAKHILIIYHLIVNFNYISHSFSTLHSLPICFPRSLPLFLLFICVQFSCSLAKMEMCIITNYTFPSVL